MRKNFFYPLLILLLCALAGRIFPADRASRQTTRVESLKRQENQNKVTEPARITNVIDGDTLELADGRRVRLIGIDCPESRMNAKLKRDIERTGQDERTIVRMGKQATSFTKSIALNQDVRMEFDVQKNDRYGRLLAYVYLSDGTFLNAEIVKNGFAVPMTIPPNVRYAQLFRQLDRQAREKQLGLYHPDL